MTALSTPNPNLTRPENWLASRRQDAGYFLVLVAGLMLWTAGFVDLVTHTSTPPTLLGKYSVPYALFLCAYALGFGMWIWLLAHPRGITLVKRVVQAIQQRWWLGLAGMIAFAALVMSMFLVQRWTQLPLFQLSVLLMGLLAVGAILLARPAPRVKVQTWRKAILGVIGLLVAIEALLQFAAAAGVLPVENMSGAHAAYGRIYQNREGLGNGTTNRYGWYYPEVKPAPGRVVILTGDTYVQGLQVTPDQNVGVALQRLIKAGGVGNVISMGFPGYGPALYADTKLAPYSMLQFNPSEVVVLFHLANDLQTVTAPTGQIPFYTVDAAGDVAVAEQDAQRRHSLQHLIIRAYDPVNPVQTLQSHIFIVQLLKRSLDPGYVYVQYGDQGVPPVYPLNADSATTAQPFGASTFAFDVRGNAEAERAMTVAKGQLKALKTELEALGISMRLVTIPYFPAAFYAQQGANWSAQMGEYDALLPEAELGKFAQANNLPFLPMGKYMRQTGMTAEQIKALFFKDGTGHFTPEGHALFATAMQRCFYASGDACPLDAN